MTPKDPDIIFWMTARAALIMLVRAIEKRYRLKDYDFSSKIVEVGVNDSIAIPQK